MSRWPEGYSAGPVPMSQYLAQLRAAEDSMADLRTSTIKAVEDAGGEVIEHQDEMTIVNCDFAVVEAATAAWMERQNGTQ